MANINKDGYIKTQDANGNIVTVYPYTKAGNVDGLDVFGASGSNHSTGLVPDPGATAGTSKYLREDGTWAEPAGGGGGGGSVDTVYIGSTEYAPDANGKVTLPSYPTSLPASDVYSWAKASSKPSYTYSEVGAASSGHTHSNATTSSSGFMSYSDKSKLNGIDSGANYYTHPTGAGYKHIPSGGSSGQFLKYSSSGTAQWSSLSLSDVGLKAIEYTFTLSQAAFSKSGSGLYYRSLDISSDFDTVIAATMSVWSGLQNYGFTPYISSPARVGIVLHAPGKTDSSISFSSGYIKVMVLGY